MVISALFQQMFQVPIGQNVAYRERLMNIILAYVRDERYSNTKV